MKSVKLPEIKHVAWNLKPLFKGDDDPRTKEERKVIKQKNYEFIKKWKNRDDYLKDSIILRQALDEYEQLERFYGVDGDEGYYFWLRIVQDQNNPKLKAKLNKIEEFGTKIRNDIQFFELKIAKISAHLREKFLKREELKPYKYFLKSLFEASEYLLSEPEEKILNLKSNTSHSNWARMVSEFLSKEEKEVLLEDGSKGTKSFSEISSLTDSKNKKVRDSAAKAFNKILAKHADVAEAEINSVLENKKIDDELRKMPRPDFSRHLGDGIDSGVVDVLISSVSDRFDIPAKYYKLKAALLRVKRLKYHERNVPAGKAEKKYSYKEAVNLICRVLKGIDGKFADIFVNFVENGQIDVYPKKGKSGGAFCAHYLISQPTFILLNYTDKLDDVLTTAHESGHGINNELMKEKQNALNFGSPTFIAEVASTFMEDFVLEEILKEADDELRLAVMMMKLNDDVSSIFRQVAFYKFEQELHKKFRRKGYLSKEEIGRMLRKHTKAYMGDFVEQSPGSENWWIHVPHFRYFFYVYSYASGLLISKSLQSSVKNNPGFVAKVKKLLSAGSSDSPENIFKRLGIDITRKEFWDKGLNEINCLLEETIKLAKKLGKIINF